MRAILSFLLIHGFGLILLLSVVAFFWVMIDLQFVKRFTRIFTVWTHEGRWEDLALLCEKTLRSVRPGYVIVRNVVTPGGLENLYASHLYQMGRVEECLAWSERAASSSERKNPAVHRQAVTAMIAALSELGRYQDALDLGARSEGAELVRAAALFRLGRLDEALTLALSLGDHLEQGFPPAVSALVYLMKGDFKPGLEVLRRPVEVPAAFQQQTDAEQRRRWTATVEVLQFLHLAYLYLEMGDVKNLRVSLDQAEQILSGHPVHRMIHAQLKACLAAAEGDAAGVERCIAEGTALLARTPRRSSRQDFFRYVGRAHLTLNRFNDALAALEESRKACLHPIEFHCTHFWMARAHDAKGDSVRAGEYDARVIGDRIPSAYAALAAKASRRAPSGSTPAS